MLIGTIQQIWRYPVKSMAGERLSECSVQALGIPGDRGWALRDEVAREITNGKRIPLLMQCAARYREEPGDASIPHVEIDLPDGSSVRSDDPDVNDRLSGVLGKDVTLWPLQPATDKSHYRRAKFSSRLAGRLSQYGAFRSMLPALTSFGSMNVALREVFSREAGEPIPDISILPPEVLEFTSPPGTYFDAFPIHLLTTASLEAMSKRNASAVWDVRRFRPNFFVQTADGVEGLVEPKWAGRTLRIGTVKLKCEIPTARCGMTTHAQSGLAKDPTVLRSIVKDADQNLGIYANVISGGKVSKGDQVELL
ncbi:MAG: MOSC N-terminal beta barrel domain-containing protein [Acidobacteriota bacterium]|nr:MOSC N-terminal beta barrel domain-containing protein [Acidobacteriota bacterium]